MRRFLADLGSRLRASPFARNVSWSVGLSLIERLIAVVQTVIISRTVGMTEYGVYGLLMSTIGLVSGAAGFQMGLPAILYISRYRHTDKHKVAGVISVIQRFGWLACAGLVLLSMFYADELARNLFDDPKYKVIVLLGAWIAAVSVLSGLQDGIAQGFEIFKTLAKLKSATAALSLLLIVPATELFGLEGVLAVLLAGLLAKYILLGRTVRGIRRKEAIPRRGTGIRFLPLLTDIALPSVAVSIITGFTGWLGMFLLSKQVRGFDSVAIVNTGIQWRGPVLLVAASLGSVAIPAFSRLISTGDKNRSRRFRGLLIRANLVIAIGIALPLVVFSSLVLRLYGPDFLAGRLSFTLILLSAVPTVLANVYLQELLGAARLWRQLVLYIPYFGVQLVGFWLLVPRFGALGFGIVLIAGSLALLLTVLLAQWCDPGDKDSAGHRDFEFLRASE
jgi:O-antigen/teichoic acid export membrane protein